MGDFFWKIGEGLRGFPKSNLGGRKVWANFSRNLERVWIDFQKRILAGGAHWGNCQEIWRGFVWISNKQYWEETTWEFFWKFRDGLAWISKKQYWREEIMEEFSRNLERICLVSEKATETMGEFSRNLERVCVDSQKTILAGANKGGNFPEIWNWREETKGESL